jgi:hypothetical protein
MRSDGGRLLLVGDLHAKESVDTDTTILGRLIVTIFPVDHGEEGKM